MENPAAIRKKCHDHALSRSVSHVGPNNTSRQSTDSHEDGPHATERTSLLGRSQDPRAWVRWPAYTAWATKETLLGNYINALLVFVPLGIIAGAMGWNPTAVFVLNFLAIIPLASLLSFATEELSVKLGQTLGGLLNATFGNAVELIVRVDWHHQTRYELTRATG